MPPKYPHVHVQLSGEDGNAFFIIGRVRRAMRDAGLSADDLATYSNEAMDGDYEHVLTVTADTVSVS
jgi:predicted transglutaminase-like cysteine proteinase